MISFTVRCPEEKNTIFVVLVYAIVRSEVTYAQSSSGTSYSLTVKQNLGRT